MLYKVICMKKTLLDHIPDQLPPEIQRFVSGARLYDSSCSPEARVYFIDRENGYYLKCAGKGTLAREAQMTAYFHKKGFGAEVVSYLSADRDWLLTSAVKGEDCVHERYLSQPKRLCDTLAQTLRQLHETDYTDCPVMDRTAEYLAFAESNYRAGVFDASLFPEGIGYRTAEDAQAVLTDGKAALQSRVLLHGDYCLPNVMLDDWKLSGFIDVGCGGVGDRHIDIFWGVWTLRYNLKTDAYRARFLDAYGRDLANEELIRVIAAAEVFG